LKHLNGLKILSIEKITDPLAHHGAIQNLINDYLLNNLHLNQFEVIKFPYLFYVDCYKVQKNYPQIKFRWTILNALDYERPIYDCYEGDFNENNATVGKGVYYWKNGNRYDGYFKNKLREGKGVYYGQDGDRYEGEWKNDLLEGRGLYFDRSGLKYDGEWKEWRKEGNGIYYYLLARYEGEWKNDLKSGIGTLYYDNGDRYEGEWKDDMFNGRGSYFNADGSRYEGE
jgi:hypothetical protein